MNSSDVVMATDGIRISSTCLGSIGTSNARGGALLAIVA